MILQIDISKNEDILRWIQNNEKNERKDQIITTALSIGLQSIQLSETRLDGVSYIQPIQDIATSTKDIIEGLDDKINDIFHFKSNSMKKGQLGETIAIRSLMKRYPSWEIIDMSQENYSGDSLAKHTPIGDILYEIKNYDYNINKEQLIKFYRDLDNMGIRYGVFVSHTSGIVGKKNIEWEIKSDKLVVFISNMGLNGMGIEIATELLLSLVSMNIMNQEENYVVKYNIDMDTIIDELNEHISKIKDCVQSASNHRQLVIEQNKKINEHLYIIEKHAGKCELDIEYLFHKIIGFVSDLKIDTSVVHKQNENDIGIYIESLDSKNSKLFSELYKLIDKHKIDIMFQGKDWICMKNETMIAKTKIGKTKTDIIFPITNKKIEVDIDHEIIKNKELYITLKDNYIIWEIIDKRLS